MASGSGNNNGLEVLRDKILIEACFLLLFNSFFSYFFISSARAANGLCVAVGDFGELKDESEKYCWSV